MRELKTLAREYIYLFSQKNLKELKNLFDENIKLLDWENEIEGINELLDFNAKVFMNFEHIEIDILNIVADENLVFIEMIIKLDKNIELKVVDIIKFSKNNKIIMIKAYKS